jgi:hypothetical protein
MLVILVTQEIEAEGCEFEVSPDKGSKTRQKQINNKRLEGIAKVALKPWVQSSVLEKKQKTNHMSMSI